MNRWGDPMLEPRRRNCRKPRLAFRQALENSATGPRRTGITVERRIENEVLGEEPGGSLRASLFRERSSPSEPLNSGAPSAISRMFYRVV